VLRERDGGGIDSPALSPEIQLLHLTPADKADLLAFLRALSADSVTCAPFPCTPPA